MRLIVLFHLFSAPILGKIAQVSNCFSMYHGWHLINQKILLQFYIEPAQKVASTYVTQLVEGRLQRIQQV